jgi:hypothetical protein
LANPEYKRQSKDIDTIINQHVNIEHDILDPNNKLADLMIKFKQSYEYLREKNHQTR